jgi:O-antigen/teichoic acid export membrane protein
MFRFRLFGGGTRKLPVSERLRSLIGVSKSQLARNTFWLSMNSIINMAISVVVVAITARYFGPEAFGRFNYALSVVLLFTAISTLGLETLTVRSLVSGEHRHADVLGTSLALRLVGGIILTGISVATATALEPGDPGLRLLTLLLSMMMVFKSFDVIDYWFQSRLMAKTSSIIRIASYSMSACLKLLLVAEHGNIYQYSGIYAIDALIVAFGFIVAYSRQNKGRSRWRFDKGYAKYILSRSWYVMLSGLMGTLYMRVDQVMLGYMVGDKSVLGVYASAVTMSGLWYFVPLAAISSANPRIMREKVVDSVAYETHVQDLYTAVAWMGIAFSLTIAAFADLIVVTLYGSAFREAAGMLRISVFAGVFALLGSAGATWLISEGLQRYSLVNTGGGALINVVMNLYLIPSMGAYGAAFSTLVAQAAAVLMIPTLFKKTRVSTMMMLRAFDVRRAWDLGRRVLRRAGAAG